MAVRAAIGYAVAARSGMLVVIAISVAILSRLLPPDAFGNYAVALAIWSFLDAVVQFGLLQLFISQDAAPERSRVARAAGLSLALALGTVGTGLACLALFSGTVISDDLATLLVPMLLTLLLRPLTLGPEIMLQRGIKFGLLSVRDFVGTLADFMVAVSLALLGFGAQALALGLLASQCAAAVLLLLLVDREHRIWPKLGGWSEFIRFGRRMTLIHLVPRISEIAMLGGLATAQGATAVGLFNRARTIHKLLDTTLLAGIKPVILPAFSAALRDGVAPAIVYRTKLDFLTALCWPVFALIALLAEDLVRVILGPQWNEAVPAVRILAMMGLAMPITKMSQKLFVALEETQRYLRIEAIREAIRIPIAVVGAFFGLEAFALAFVIGGWIKAGGVIGFMKERAGGPDGGYSAVFLPGAALSIAALLGPIVVVLADFGPLVTLVVSLPLAAMGWMAAAAILDHPIYGEAKRAITQVGTMLRRLNTH